MELLQLLGMLVVLVGVLFLTYYTTRFIARSYTFKGSTGNIKLVDRTNLAPDKSLVIVKAAQKAFLISITKDRVELISELDSALVNEPETIGTGSDFTAILKKVVKEKTGLSLPKKEEENDS